MLKHPGKYKLLTTAKVACGQSEFRWKAVLQPQAIKVAAPA